MINFRNWPTYCSLGKHFCLKCIQDSAKNGNRNRGGIGVLSNNCSPCSKFAAKSATDLCERIQLHSWRFFLSKSVADARKYMAGLKHICVQCTSTHKISTTKWWQQFKHKVCSLLLLFRTWSFIRSFRVAIKVHQLGQIVHGICVLTFSHTFGKIGRQGRLGT